MFDNLSNKDIRVAIDELVACLGVREETPYREFAAFLQDKDIEACVDEIAGRLGLPVHINISYVKRDAESDDEQGFDTTALVRTDSSGRGIGGIVAQVLIPRYLPKFGTAELKGYPIQVRVSESCRAHSTVFAVLMAHELSHVLLASLDHPQKDSELHADLVPIVLGFGDIVRIGRKTSKSTTIGKITITDVTTYGYLTDSQVQFACSYVGRILRRHLKEKKSLAIIVKQVQKKLGRATRCLATFRDYFSYLDMHPPTRMKREHAERLVQLHARDHAREWEQDIAELNVVVEGARLFAENVSHYTDSSLEKLTTYKRDLELVSDKINHIIRSITVENKILQRYVGLSYVLQRALRRQS